MTTTDLIISRILEARPDLTREKLTALIEEKKSEAGGLLSEEGAARLVAEQLLIETETRPLGGLSISGLTSGLNDVTVTGRVIAVRPVQGFQRRNGQQGRVLTAILADMSGQIRCALWDNKVDEALKAGITPGRILRVRHGYTKNGLSGQPEFHVGDRSTILLDPPDASDADFPKAMTAEFTKISEISSELPRANIQARLRTQPRIINFQSEGRKGRVLRAQISDESGNINIAAWDEKVEEIERLGQGSSLQLMNARVRRDRAGLLEVHLDSSSNVTVLSQTVVASSVELSPGSALKIAELKGGQFGITTVAKVLAKSDVVETKRLTGEPLRYARILIGDDTGISTAVFWDEKAAICSNISLGDVLEIIGASVRERQGDLSVSVGSQTQVNTQNDPSGLASAPKVTKVAELSQAVGLVAVQGRVDEEPLVREVVTAKNESVSVGSFHLRDDSGRIRVNFWRQRSELVSKLRAGMTVKITGLRAKPGLGGSLELSSIPLTNLEALEPDAPARPSWGEVTQIIALEKAGPAWVRGLVLEFSGDASLKATCGYCGGTMQAVMASLTCTACGKTGSVAWAFSGVVRVDDGTGAMMVVFDSVDSRPFLLNLHPWAARRAVETQRSVIKLPAEAMDRFVGSTIEISGDISFDKAGKPMMRAKQAVSVSET